MNLFYNRIIPIAIPVVLVLLPWLWRFTRQFGFILHFRKRRKFADKLLEHNSTLESLVNQIPDYNEKDPVYLPDLRWNVPRLNFDVKEGMTEVEVEEIERREVREILDIVASAGEALYNSCTILRELIESKLRKKMDYSYQEHLIAVSAAAHMTAGIVTVESSGTTLIDHNSITKNLEAINHSISYIARYMKNPTRNVDATLLPIRHQRMLEIAEESIPVTLAGRVIPIPGRIDPQTGLDAYGVTGAFSHILPRRSE